MEKVVELRKQAWREYEFNGTTYRVNDPVKLVYTPGGKNHRVTDVNGVTHILPSPGWQGCVVRTKSRGCTCC